MKATKKSQRNHQAVEVQIHGQGTTYTCRKCGLKKESNTFYEADYRDMIAHASGCAGTGLLEEDKTMDNDQQFEALASLVADWAVKRNPNVKGPYTSGEYVTHRLNEIFTPAGWSFTILNGPEVITLNDKMAYAQVVGRLEVTFTDGHQAHQDDIGIWPLMATNAKKGGTLEETAPERYETVCKAARTDCLKNAARNLGHCFAPLGDLELEETITREAYRNGARVKAETAKPAEAHIDDLFGAEPIADIITAYKSGQRPLPAWAEELRQEISQDSKVSDPVGKDWIDKLLAAAEGKGLSRARFEAFVQIALGHLVEELTFGEVRVLKAHLDNDLAARIAELLTS